MSKVRVLVLDDGTADGLLDLGSAFTLGDVEVVGTLRIETHPTSAAAIASADTVGTGSRAQSVLRETAAGSLKAPAALETRDTRGASAGGAGSANRDATVYLTRAELDVLRLLAKGLRNKDIAKELYISVNTVKTHVASIFRKLRVKNRSQAVMYVYSRSQR